MKYPRYFISSLPCSAMYWKVLNEKGHTAVIYKDGVLNISICGSNMWQSWLEKGIVKETTVEELALIV